MMMRTKTPLLIFLPRPRRRQQPKQNSRSPHSTPGSAPKSLGTPRPASPSSWPRWTPGSAASSRPRARPQRKKESKEQKRKKRRILTWASGSFVARQRPSPPRTPPVSAPPPHSGSSASSSEDQGTANKLHGGPSLRQLSPPSGPSTDSFRRRTGTTMRSSAREGPATSTWTWNSKKTQPWTQRGQGRRRGRCGGTQGARAPLAWASRGFGLRRRRRPRARLVERRKVLTTRDDPAARLRVRDERGRWGGGEGGGV